MRSRPLAQALRRIGAKLESWQVRALFLGAHASTNLRLGPQHLLSRICGDEPILGNDLADANENLQSLTTLWNELVDEHRAGGIRLSRVRIGKQPTAKQIEMLIARRNGEITWFLRGLDAGGDDAMQFGDDGVALFRRLAEASVFLDSFQELLARTDESELAKARKTLDELTGAIEMIMQDLLTLSDAIRNEALAEYAAPVKRPVKTSLH